jgi:hypothetical protein
MSIPKKEISKDDMASLKEAASELLKSKEKVDGVLEGLHGIPMNIDRLGGVCFTIRSIAGDLEFCATKITDIIKED